jgi:hypothetical protein
MGGQFVNYENFVNYVKKGFYCKIKKNRVMETTKPRRKKMPRGAYLIEDGVWTKLDATNTPKPTKLSKFGLWRRENPPLVEIIDMRAVLK